MLTGESPPHSHRLALIITSEASTHLILLELTVPWEERIDEVNERKHTVQGNSGRVQGQRLEDNMSRKHFDWQQRLLHSDLKCLHAPVILDAVLFFSTVWVP